MSAFKILTCTPILKRHLEKPRRRCDHNTRMDVKEIGINTRNWDGTAKYMDYWRALCECCNEPCVSISMELIRYYNKN